MYVSDEPAGVCAKFWRWIENASFQLPAFSDLFAAAGSEMQLFAWRWIRSRVSQSSFAFHCEKVRSRPVA